LWVRVPPPPPKGVDMEYDTKSCKYIALDYKVAFPIDFNGWPREVRILAVKGLEKAFGTDCILFDPENSISITDAIRIFDERHMYHEEV
jgi:hypothetical protein